MQAIRSLLFTVAYFEVSCWTLVVLFFLSPRRIAAIYGRLDAKEQEKRLASMGPFLNPGETVLDIGSGSGRFGKAVQERFNVAVTGVDVCDYADGTIPFFLYDGHTLPFPDNAFDVAFFAFVLHHIEDQQTILEEACRVARKQVIIFEDTYERFWERWFVWWNDYHTNIFQGWIKARKGYLKGSPTSIPMPLTFRSVRGWQEFLAQFPVEPVLYSIRTMGYKPLKKVTIHLKMKKTVTENQTAGAVV